MSQDRSLSWDRIEHLEKEVDSFREKISPSVFLAHMEILRRIF